MLYLFHGSDEGKTRAKAFAWIAAARAKEPNLVYRRLTREELSPAALADAVSSGGLFVSRLLILLDDPFPHARASEEDTETDETHAASILEDHLDVLAASDNAIVVLAPRLRAAKAKKLAAKAVKEYRLDEASRNKERGFNSTLVNALAARSREKLWLEIMRALRAGDAPEMLHGLLHWKARDILEKGSSTSSPQGSAKWTREEARALSMQLITLLMDSRRHGLDLAASLEHFALSV